MASLEVDKTLWPSGGLNRALSLIWRCLEGNPKLREEELLIVQRAAFMKTFGEHIAERIAPKGKSNSMTPLA